MIALSASLFPSVAWFLKACQQDRMDIATGGNYEKQSHFNRYIIAGPNGFQNMVVPVNHTGEKKLLKDASISQHSKWNREHVHALNCAYNKAPFYEFYDYKLHEILNRNHPNLLDLMEESIVFLHRQFRLEVPINFVNEWQPNLLECTVPKYPQVFEEKFGFRPHISALDLLFNLGPEAGDYLKTNSSLSTE
jgi:hypothetical protein